MGAELFIDIRYNKKEKKLINYSGCTKTYISKLIVLEDDEIKTSEVDSVNQMLNMNMAKSRYYLNQDVEKLRVALPQLNVCNSVRLSMPSLKLYDEFAVVSTNFLFKDSGIFCDSPPSSTEKDSVEQENKSQAEPKKDTKDRAKEATKITDL